ncbi:SRPBCC domain-containing protein [Pararhodobacter oceanensis]|uniref:SRPBCC domain-containing protein n=1 Tax=Pararhodobacter oceanensis TaxID=2172121 RepID=UPI003A8FA8B8
MSEVPREVTRSIVVAAAPVRAWEGFTDGINQWWPREHSHCQEAALDRIFIDLAQGFWGERSLAGKIESWGIARSPAPGRTLELGWQMDATVQPWRAEPDPANASLITVDFAPEGDGTRVTLRHDGFERHGPGAAEMIRVMIGLDRWADWLEDYARSL